MGDWVARWNTDTPANDILVHVANRPTFRGLSSSTVAALCRERFWQSDGTRIIAELNGYPYTLLTVYITSHPAAGHKSLSNSYLGNLQIIELQLRREDRFVVEVR